MTSGRPTPGRRAAAVALAAALALAAGGILATVHRADAQADRVRTLVERAARAVRDRDLEAARRFVGEAARLAPTPDRLRDLGAVELARGDTEAALRAFAEAARRAPDDLDAQRDHAGALLAAGRGAEAVRVLTDVRAACPEAPRCALDLARAALEAGRAELALAAAEDALGGSPAGDPEPAWLVGRARAALGDRDGARAAFREVLARRPGDPRATRALEALGGGPDPDAGTAARTSPASGEPRAD